MAFTPSNSRSHSANPGLGLKLTPSNTAFPRTSTVKSPSKSTRSLYEDSLSLRRIIGTTASSSCGFDCLPSAKSFAYTAGAAAVVVKLDDNLQVSQRFFRAHPSATSLNSSTPSTFLPQTTGTSSPEVRNRTVASLRDAGIGQLVAASPPGAG